MTRDIRVKFRDAYGKPKRGALVGERMYNGREYYLIRGDDRGYYCLLKELVAVISAR